MNRWTPHTVVTRAVVLLALSAATVLGSAATAASAAPPSPVERGDAESVVADAAAGATSSWSRNDPRGDESAAAAMRKRFPKKARAVDISRQRYTLGVGGFTVITHLRRVIKGKAPYRQYVHQVVVGHTNGTPVRVHLKGRFRGTSTVTSSTGVPCSGSVFDVNRRTDLAVAFIPASCLPETVTRVNTTSFNEHGPKDIAVDRMGVNVPR